MNSNDNIVDFSPFNPFETSGVSGMTKDGLLKDVVDQVFIESEDNPARWHGLPPVPQT